MNESISILYEDKDCLVINKPAGIMVHPDGKTKEETLVDWITLKYPEIKDVGEPLTLANGEVISRPGIVHRLDRETSGALLIAKTQKAFKFFKAQFKERKISKEYHVFVHGKVLKDHGTIDRPIGRSKNDFRKWSAQRGVRGLLREASTYFEVIERRDNVTFLRARPLTGRTHQIRVHFKAINHPVLCDSLYAPKQTCLFGLNRTALHAYSFEFNTIENKKVSVTAPYPNDFALALENFRKEP
jgi:23S rRNA pseudouridine1911/1915/1917 synthase